MSDNNDPVTDEADALEAREHLERQVIRNLPVPLVSAGRQSGRPVTPLTWRLVGLVLFAGFLLLLLVL